MAMTKSSCDEAGDRCAESADAAVDLEAVRLWNCAAHAHYLAALSPDRTREHFEQMAARYERKAARIEAPADEPYLEAETRIEGSAS